MKIGLIYYTHRGHTRQVGQAISEGLTHAGYSVDVIALENSEPINLSADCVPILQQPQTTDYDIFILGTPVHGGRISGPMNAFLNKVITFGGKSLVLYVTHFFQHTWGAQQALASLAAICETRKGKVMFLENVHGLFNCRQAGIVSAVEHGVLAGLQSGKDPGQA